MEYVYFKADVSRIFVKSRGLVWIFIMELVYNGLFMMQLLNYSFSECTKLGFSFFLYLKIFSFMTALSARYSSIYVYKFIFLYYNEDHGKTLLYYFYLLLSVLKNYSKKQFFQSLDNFIF